MHPFHIEHDPSKRFACSRSPMATPPPTRKIVQELNLEQFLSSDMTVSSTINIKQPRRAQPNNDLLSEDEFQRVIEDLTPADRNLFDEFLGGMKYRIDSIDPILSLQQNETGLRRHSSLAVPQDRRRNSTPRGPNTIHYSPHAANTPSRQSAAALKQMADQHQQRVVYNHPLPPSYAAFPYSSTRECHPYSSDVMDIFADPVSRFTPSRWTALDIELI